MKEISVFREKLHEHLQWNRARLLFVSMFLIASVSTAPIGDLVRQGMGNKIINVGTVVVNL
jgi:hypothetical protein